MYRVGKIQLSIRSGVKAKPPWVSAFIRDGEIFAIHLNHLGQVVATHVPSGRKLGGPWRDFTLADRFLDALELIHADWGEARVALTADQALRLRKIDLEIADAERDDEEWTPGPGDLPDV